MEVVLPSKECILSQITCLICHQIPHDPSSVVYLCVGRAHLYCSICYGSGTFKGKKCRMTGCQEIVRKTVEPMLLDIYMNSSFRCENQMCSSVILGGHLKAHVASCHYAPIECPACKVIVLFQNYLVHLEKYHEVEIRAVFPVDTARYIQIKFPPSDSYGQSLSHFHNFRGEPFFIHFMIKPKEIMIWIQYYGDVWREKEFTVVVSLSNSNGHKTEVTVPVSPITVTLKNILKTQNYAHFTKESIKYYFLDPNELSSPTGSRPGLGTHAPVSRRTSQLSMRSNSEVNIHKLEHSNSLSSNDVFLASGLLPFRILFSHNLNDDYLRVFNASLYYESKNSGYGLESDC